MRLISIILLILAFSAAAANMAWCDSDMIVSSRNGAEAQVVVNSGDALMLRTGLWCRDFMVKRNYRVNFFLDDKPGFDGPVWSLETMDDCPIARSLGIDTSFLKNAHSDAYILKTLEHGGQSYVAILGRNVQGVRSGVARLIALMSDNGSELKIGRIFEQRSPFFRTRRLCVAPTGRIAQNNWWTKKNGMPESFELHKDTLWTNWSDERISKYVEQLWLQGWNSIELVEARGYRGVWTDKELAEQITPKIRLFAQVSHEYGMSVNLFIWGQSLIEEGRNWCWSDVKAPGQNSFMRGEYRRLAQTYGDVADSITVHVGDPGGCDCGTCDPYKTTQEIASCLYSEFKRINPSVKCTLSTWANEGFWQGRPGVRFLDESYSPKEIAIALHRWYDKEKAKIVRESGRELDVWGWYLSDYEMELDSALQMNTLDMYFSGLPDSASDDVRAISTELCFHGWPQVINAYVSAQKMWEPKRALEDIEREFCAGAFGESNADAMMKVYKACERYYHAERYMCFRPETDHPESGFGKAEYNAQVRDAIAAGEGVRLGANPRFTQATPPQALYDYLMRNLRLISVMSQAMEDIRTASGKDYTDVAAKNTQLDRIFDNAQKNAQAFMDDPDYNQAVKDLRVAVKTIKAGKEIK